MAQVEFSVPDPALTFENDKRLVCDIAGRYILVPRGQKSGPAIQCRIKRICERAATLHGLPRGAIGDAVLFASEPFGTIRGTLERRIGPMLMVRIELEDGRRAKLAKKVSWLQRKRVYQLSENRASNRFEPQNQLSTLLFGDGRWCECLIEDLSITGAAVVAEQEVRIGDVLALGKAVCRVVRRTENGFAVQFISPQERSTVEAAIAPVQPVMMI